MIQSQSKDMRTQIWWSNKSSCTSILASLLPMSTIMASFTPLSDVKALNASSLFSCFPTSITRLLAISVLIDDDGGRIEVGSFGALLGTAMCRWIGFFARKHEGQFKNAFVFFQSTFSLIWCIRCVVLPIVWSPCALELCKSFIANGRLTFACFSIRLSKRPEQYSLRALILGALSIC